MANMFDAAVQDLDVTVRSGIVRVRDGQDTWLCEHEGWLIVANQLESREQHPADVGGAEAYSLLCRKVASVSPVASLNGTSRGDWRPIVEMANEAGLIDADDATAFLA